ncbi:MAG TPA: hypothetical protein VI997_00010 [Candidatus Thermoplasmatota archaeon]|nr:hypothetical protein [Candidatus Thermoplasmatota archaeon]
MTAAPRGPRPRARRAFAVAVLTALVTAGCLGNDEPVATASTDLRDAVGDRTADAIEARAALVPRNYSFPEQRSLPQVVLYKNATIDSTANTGYEDRNDRGGNHHGVKIFAEDYSGVIPPGQPVEIRVNLLAAMTAGQSADLDIYVDVPGTRTDFDPSSQDEFNWKFTSKSRTVSTVGVAGAKHEIGVAAANGKIAPGQQLAYTLVIELTYVKDVLTPFHPWAIELPENASGLVISSVKGSGPEHVRSRFIVLDPEDEPVGLVDFNDIAIPTQSVFVATNGPGTYVFYAWEMTGGFLEVQADVPVPMRDARPLEQVEVAAVDSAAPAPGFPARDWTHDGATKTPGASGGTASFSVTGAFPLRITPTMGEGATGAAEVRITSPLGVVASMQRVARFDQGEDRLGYTQDEFNTEFYPVNLAKGEYKVEFVNDAPALEIGHVVLAYVR